ncbi:MAG TPA: glucose-6-phosphate dehydrogenase assembly protein OpcA [Polyangia bacterium]|nr:glucose-6-phosphate dehydrogenase assembly protein OpcA [Polyangia bacterium]
MSEAERARANFERFARGEPIAVEVGEIERELGSLWQQASQAGGSVVSRAVLWNLVVPTRGQAGLEKTKALCDALAPVVPVRAIALCIDDASGGSALTATIDSNVVSQPGGGRVVCCEEISLVGPPGTEAHFGAIVRALQVPGVRTATLWMDAAMPSALLARELLPATRRLIVDTASCGRPIQLRDLEALATRAYPRPVADLGWLRLESFRLLFAGLFDPPVGGGPLRHASRLTVRYRAGGDVSALLAVAWLGLLLDWKPTRAAETSDGGLRFDFERDDQGQVQAFLSPSGAACDRSAILAIELVNGRDEYAVIRTAVDQAEVRLPIAPPRTVKLDAASDAELVVAALGPRGRDPLFARSLTYAARLWSLEPRSAGSRR